MRGTGRIYNSSVEGAPGAGFDVGSGISLDGCTSVGNAGDGIVARGAIDIRNTSAIANRGVGFRLVSEVTMPSPTTSTPSTKSNIADVDKLNEQPKGTSEGN